MFREDDVLVKKYVRIILNTYSNIFLPVFKNNSFNFRCNICKDSIKNLKKRRGNIVKYKGVWFFKCFNCGKTMTLKNWMKVYYYSFYKDFIRESLQLNLVQVNSELEIEEKKEEKESLDTKYFKKIILSNGELREKAIYHCNSRKISNNIWNDWYICENGRYRGRLVIPFYDDKGKIYYWQARKLDEHIEPKYLNRLMGRDEAIYNYYFINKYKPVIVTEGIIDSIFLDNAIAVLGLTWSDKVQNKLNELDCYYLLDNDEPGFIKSKELLIEGKKVFLWKKYFKENNISSNIKDVNDLYLFLNRDKKIEFEELKKYFTNSYFDSVYL